MALVTSSLTYSSSSTTNTLIGILATHRRTRKGQEYWYWTNATSVPLAPLPIILHQALRYRVPAQCRRKPHPERLEWPFLPHNGREVYQMPWPIYMYFL